MSEDRAHALLSPSSAERWLSCPASVRVIEQLGIEEKSSRYADEGTAAHALGEIKLRAQLDKLSPREYGHLRDAWAAEYPYPDDQVSEMERHTDAYTMLVWEHADKFPSSTVQIERRVHPGIPECHGTADVIISSPTHVEVIDFKYGQGVRVNAAGNPQLRIYALGAANEVPGLRDDHEVYWTVFQPRLDHVDTDSAPLVELLEWRDEYVKPRAGAALGEAGEFGPSENACRWCPASGRCRARMEWSTKNTFIDLTAVESTPEPDLLDEQEMADALTMLPRLRDWCSAVEAAALQMAYVDQRAIPGRKVVLSGGQRRCADPDTVADVLDMLGHPESSVYAPKKLRGIGELEKLLGKKEFDYLLGAYFPKSEGSPSLVADTDPRPAVNRQAELEKVFDVYE